MGNTGVYVDGLRATVRQLEALGVEVDEIKDVMAGIAAEAAETAIPRIPKRSGKLRGSVRGNRAKGKAVVTFGRASVPYAGPIIFGWPKRNIRPLDVIDYTDRVMEVKAVEMLEEGFKAICERHGLA